MRKRLLSNDFAEVGLLITRKQVATILDLYFNIGHIISCLFLYIQYRRILVAENEIIYP